MNERKRKKTVEGLSVSILSQLRYLAGEFERYAEYMVNGDHELLLKAFNVTIKEVLNLNRNLLTYTVLQSVRGIPETRKKKG
jgi:hypothetical protein